jgi:hypothetical protein
MVLHTGSHKEALDAAFGSDFGRSVAADAIAHYAFVC